MRTLMEYKIISGPVVEIRRTYFSTRGGGKKTRGTRIAGNSSAKKIRANEAERVKQLARIINSNPELRMMATPKYDDEHLPGSYEDAEASYKKWLRVFRESYRKRYGVNPQYIAVTGNWSPDHDRPARLHHHLIVPGCSRDMIAELWQGGGVDFADMDNRKDHTAMAVYLISNVHGQPRGKNTWICSRGNLAKPIYTEPEEVADGVEGVQILPGAVQTAFERLDDEDGRPLSAYVRCILPAVPKVRRNTVILPRPPKRGGRKAEAG